jgi:fructokinase
MNTNNFLIKKESIIKEKIFNIVGLGEILWDIFPEGKKLGGAPTNFAYYAKSLGQNGIIASRVGSDPLGKEILDHIEDLVLDGTYIQSDSSYPTGTVDVKLDETGQPDYIINKKVAWDYLTLNNDLEKLALKADAVCFGTLAQRSSKSKDTISKFLKLTGNDTMKIFDINLRQNFYSGKMIRQSLEDANILKLNSHELEILKDMLGHSNDISEINLCKEIINDYDLELLCLTKGDRGSLILNRSDHFIHRGCKVEVADTVGAGDAFTAAMIVQYLKGKTLKEISNAANKLGSWVSSQRGATPAISEKFLKNIF